MKLLDCFCGLGGASEGFHREGFDCTGIDIENMGYPYRFIQADITRVDASDFEGYDVIWGSPPCRDFSIFAKRFGKTWKKNPPNPEQGLILVKAFLKFVEQTKPKYWIMENVPGLIPYLGIQPSFTSCLGPPEKQQMRRSFWGTFPPFLLPIKHNMLVARYRPEVGRKAKRNQSERAKIPLTCSLAFAKACREQLN